MDRPKKPSGRHAVRLRRDEIITRISLDLIFGHTGVAGSTNQVTEVGPTDKFLRN